MKKVDFLIIGQGLAGTLLIHDLLEKEYSVTIIDKNLRASASRVAAGLINPVGMKRCIPSFNAHNFLPKAIERYQELEKKLDVTFLHLMPILRLFSNNVVKHQWQVKYSNTEMQDYIHRFYHANHFSSLKDDFGSASVSPSGYLDTNKFLDHSRLYFKTACNLLEEEFDFSAFIPENITYKDIEAKTIIFCEGFRVMHNPLFSKLPLTPTKGEVLTIRIHEISHFDSIISKGVYILPLGNHSYTVGATYNHTDFTDETTSEGKDFLITKLQEMLEVDFEVVTSEAGVRPTVKDRRFLIGLHPKYDRIGVFNGLGTRGVLQGPLLSYDFSVFLTQPKQDVQNAENQRLIRFLS